MRVAAAFGAGRRRESKHTLDSERDLRRGLGDDNFAVRSCVPRQFDQTCFPEPVHGLVRHRRLGGTGEVVSNAGG